MRAVLLALTLAALPAFGQKTVEVRLGDWRASYSTFPSPAAVCDAEAPWLADELQSVNTLLDGFLAMRGGAWTQGHLPLLEQAAKVLPPLLEAVGATLDALSRCPLGSQGRFPELIARGAPLVKEARQEVARLPELIRFVKHRVALDKWEKQRLEALEPARAACKGTKPGEPSVFFAWEDEFGTRHWLFCDGGEVLAPPAKTWLHQPKDGAKADPRVASMSIQAARLYPEARLLRAPKP
ncbi:MAG: hypothetical protein AMXMBFR34_32590 [Myxococcaceae bacterium]